MKHTQRIIDAPSQTAKKLVIVPLVLAAALIIFAVVGYFAILRFYDLHPLEPPREDWLSVILLFLVFVGAGVLFAATVVLSIIALSLTKKAIEPGWIKTAAIIELVVSAVLLTLILIQYHKVF